MSSRPFHSRRAAGLLVFTLCLAPPCLSTEIQVTARHGRSVRAELAGHPLLVLRGTHRERGEAQGVLAGREILRFIDEGYVPLFRAATKQPDAWERRLPNHAKFVWPERFRQEFEGLLEGIRKGAASADERQIKALGREVKIEDLYLLAWMHDLERYECSSFSVWGPLSADGQTLFARNSDNPVFPRHAETLALIAVEPAEPGLKATLDIRGLGFLGANTALNQDGVIQAVNEGNERGPTSKESRTPRILAMREAIERAGASTPLEDIVAVLRGTPVRVGSVLHVSFPCAGGAARVPAVLEWDGVLEDGKGVTVRKPEDGGAMPFVVSTNHFLARKSQPAAENSRQRYRCLHDELARRLADKRPVDEQAARTLLDSVAKNTPEVLTQFSAVIRPHERRLALAYTPRPGVPSTQGAWVEISWADVFGLK